MPHAWHTPHVAHACACWQCWHVATGAQAPPHVASPHAKQPTQCTHAVWVVVWVACAPVARLVGVCMVLTP